MQRLPPQPWRYPFKKIFVMNDTCRRHRDPKRVSCSQS
ncbi:hypothetical protein GLE_5472 [Lysobacter enzymogenes]|uniref:Uncharacterized protein n=1 Tax=Lysobacter enzymogenes TaxID=69 RepID=A0A0S2DQZ1_LYSEN|nr:hypothetical protein GLE_5472 [Lysobacter enzymogenes]